MSCTLQCTDAPAPSAQGGRITWVMTVEAERHTLLSAHHCASSSPPKRGQCRLGSNPSGAWLAPAMLLSPKMAQADSPPTEGAVPITYTSSLLLGSVTRKRHTFWGWPYALSAGAITGSTQVSGMRHCRAGWGRMGRARGGLQVRRSAWVLPAPASSCGERLTSVPSSAQ